MLKKKVKRKQNSDTNCRDHKRKCTITFRTRQQRGIVRQQISPANRCIELAGRDSLFLRCNLKLSNMPNGKVRARNLVLKLSG